MIVSDRKDLSITLPEWYRMELQTQKTMLKLSRVQELEFYLNHPDEYIRHQAILRLGQLRDKEALAPLSRIIDDPLEIPLNREIAAWVLKSTGLVRNDGYYIGNHYLDKYTGNEKLQDFYYPSFIEDRTKPEYHFSSSGIEALLSEEILLIRAESLEENMELPFSLGRWLQTWAKTRLETLRKGFEALGKRSAAMLSGLIQKIIHPEKRQDIRKQKQHPIRGTNPDVGKKSVHTENRELQTGTPADVMKPVHAAYPEIQTEPSATVTKPTVQAVYPENAVISDEPLPVGVHRTDNVYNPGYYRKPFTLKSCPQDKESRKHRSKSQIYVRGKYRDFTFTDAVKGIAEKFIKIILLPFVILWNQKVVFLTLIVCLYLFFTFVPFGRMLFYRRSPELARMNDNAVKTAEAWVTEKIVQLQEMAFEYELVRNIQKRVATGTQDQKTVQEPVRYIVTAKTLNLRNGPGTQSDKLLVLEQNMIVEFLNQSVELEGGKIWLHIKAPDGTTGWSFAGYLKKLENGVEAYEGK
jgi:hypothetical protein